MGIQIDLQEGHTIRETEDGIEVDRVAKVTNAGGVAPSILYNAMRRTKLPKFGSNYPGIPGVRLLEIEGTATGAREAEFILKYRKPSPTQDETLNEQNGIVSIDIDSTAVTERTTEDKSGKIMIVSYIGVPTGALPVEQAYDLVEAEVYRPQLFVRIAQIRKTLPKTLSTQYIAAINSDRWSGYDRLTWLVQSIRTSKQEDNKFRVEWEFAFRRETWLVTHSIRINGRIPIDAAVGNGIQSFSVYDERPFARLGVRW